MARKSWFENEAFWSATEEVMFSPARIAEAKTQVEGLVALTGVKPGARVLDLCCGPGRHSLEFARRGFRVTGVDRNARYLARARRQARREDLSVEFVRSDMRRFARPRSFDLAINLFTSFGYFDRAEDDARVAANMRRSLKPGGVLVIDVRGKENMARIFQPFGWQEGQGCLILEERKVLPGWAQLETRWTVVKGNRRRAFRFKLRIYSAVELETLLRSAGFSEVKSYGDFSGIPYDNNARRLVAVARVG